MDVYEPLSRKVPTWAFQLYQICMKATTLPTLPILLERSSLRDVTLHVEASS